MADDSETQSCENISAWYRGKTFTADWTTPKFPLWTQLLAPFRQRRTSILEVGSYEGRSAIFFLNYLPSCHLTCVDVFATYPYVEYWPDIAREMPNIERRFDANLAEFGPRVRKIKATSAGSLPELLVAGAQYDIIYVDGDHRASAVLMDLLLAWPLLKTDGVLIVDDYEFDARADERDRPKLGVDKFISQLAPDQYSVVHKGYQLVLSRR